MGTIDLVIVVASFVCFVLVCAAAYGIVMLWMFLGRLFEKGNKKE
jgi:hypothetical protein